MGKNVLATHHSGSPYLRTYAHCAKKGVRLFVHLYQLSCLGKIKMLLLGCNFDVGFCLYLLQHGITALLINLSNSTSFEVNIVEDDNLYPEKVVNVAESSPQREEYHLTPQNGDLHATTILLNGEPLVLNKTGDIPPLNPKLTDPSSTIKMKPSSIAFVNIKYFKAPAC